jgi:hypothetical protein
VKTRRKKSSRRKKSHNVMSTQRDATGANRRDLKSATVRSHDEIVEVTLAAALGATADQALVGSRFKNFAGIGPFLKRSAM